MTKHYNCVENYHCLMCEFGDPHLHKCLGLGPIVSDKSVMGSRQLSYSYANIFISAPSPRDLNEVTPSGGRRARKP